MGGNRPQAANQPQAQAQPRQNMQRQNGNQRNLSPQPPNRGVSSLHFPYLRGLEKTGRICTLSMFLMLTLPYFCIASSYQHDSKTTHFCEPRNDRTRFRTQSIEMSLLYCTFSRQVIHRMMLTQYLLHDCRKKINSQYLTNSNFYIKNF